MREICTSGSVRGEGGNILTYSAALSLERREMRSEELRTTQLLDLAKEREPARGVGIGERGQEEPAEQAGKYSDRQQEAGLAAHPTGPVQ